MKAAAYIRAPHDTPDDREGQLDDIRQFAVQPGWELVGIYTDPPSGRRPDRSSFRRLLADAEQRKFDVVIIQRFDRAAGSLRELVHAFEHFRRCGVAVAFVEEAIDTSTPAETLVWDIMRAVGQFERRLTSARIRSGLARARALGRRVGRPPADIDPADVARLREQGLS